MSQTTGIVSGSGIDLSPMLDAVAEERGFDEVAHLAASSVSGHEGVFRVGRCGDVNVVLQSGRLHVYEGHSVSAVQRTVDALVDMGADRIIFTNAAGALNTGLSPGDLVAIDSAVLWPFAGWRDGPAAVSADFIVDGCDAMGRYMWVHGPTYETPAEVAAMQRLGCDAVGMSTAPEMARCKELGVSCAAVSVITNPCGGAVTLSHEHVLAKANEGSARLARVLRAFVEATE